MLHLLGISSFAAAIVDLFRHPSFDTLALSLLPAQHFFHNGKGYPAPQPYYPAFYLELNKAVSLHINEPV
jgi:hypothetical protein